MSALHLKVVNKSFYKYFYFTELLRALYDFTATDPKTLSFKQNDLFINLEKNIGSRKWWKVLNKDGCIGFIPCNYVSNQEVNLVLIIRFSSFIKMLNKYCRKTLRMF
jgi:hypothetical protein